MRAFRIIERGVESLLVSWVRHGAQGGRPSHPHTRGVGSGSAKSNRKPVGAPSLKRERDPGVFAQMCEYIDKAEKIATNEEMLREHVSSLYPHFTADEIAEIRAQQEHWQHEAQIMRLGNKPRMCT